MNFFLTILFCSISFLAGAQSQYYVLFEYNKAIVPDTAMAHLIKTIYSNEVVHIYLEGHCDSIGSRRYNYALSQKRVQAVEQILVDNGFEKYKIHGKVGFGKDKPLLPNSSNASRQKNRRVLVKFVYGNKKLVSPSNSKPLKKAIADTSITFKKIKVTKKVSPYLSVINNRKQSAKEVKAKKIIKQQTPAKRPKALIRENFTPNSTIELPNLLFQGGRHYLINQSTASLDTLVKILKEKPNLIIEIQGHVCCTSYEADGFDWDTRTDNLSVNRAEAIKIYLIQKGISSTRLKTKGFGGSQKLFPDEVNIYQRGRNRRVEIKVLSNN